MTKPLVSIIIPCKNEGKNIINTIESIKENTGSTPYEIIVVDDASDDGCCDFLREKTYSGISLITTDGVQANRARNLGVNKAIGDFLIFCDAHIFLEKDWMEKLLDSLGKKGVDAVSPGLIPHDYQGKAWGGLTWEANFSMRWQFCQDYLTPAAVLPAGCLAITKEAYESTGGVDKGFRVYGFEDVEFTLKMWLFGFGAYINPDVTVKHIFRNDRSYKIDYSDLHHNLLRMAFLHLNQKRIAKVITQVKNYPYCSDVLAEVLLSDCLERREEYQKRRVHDDDWFMQKFNIPL